MEDDLTNGEALQAITELNLEIPSLTLKKALKDQGLTASGLYTVENKKPVDLAWCSIIWTLCGSSDVEEGQVKVVLANRNSLLSLRMDILGSYGLIPNNGKPAINNAPFW
jgi:hypothetical protein